MSVTASGFAHSVGQGEDIFDALIDIMVASVDAAYLFPISSERLIQSPAWEP